jgi:DNA-binding CsgD family transcriptional regulator
MLLGRGRECGAIEHLIGAAAEPVASVLVLRGALGVGKTTLLRWAIDVGAALHHVPVVGFEGEQHFRWAVLQPMVRHLDEVLPALLPWQSDALTDVLHGAGADPTLVGAALVALFSAAAVEQPLLVTVDDVQWMDQLSRDALRFAARRIEHEPVVVLMAVEDDDASIAFAESFPELAVRGLSPIDAVTLLDGQVDTRVAEQLALVTEGNPLAMREIARQLSPEQRAGIAPLSSDLPISEVIKRGFARHAQDLSDEQGLLLLLAAAEPGLDAAKFRAAAAAAGADPSLTDSLMKPGLLSIGSDERVRFTRPLVRDSVYLSARPGERRLVHRALATVGTADADEDVRAWHLAEAADGPDAGAARALGAAATRATRRGDSPAAAHALMRAALLSSERQDKVRYLVAAGSAFVAGNLNEQAIAAFEQGLALTVDQREQAEIEIALAGPRLAASGSPRGFVELARLAGHVELIDATRASSLYSVAALTALAAGEIRSARSLCRRALDHAPHARIGTARMAGALSGMLSAFAGDCGRATQELLVFSEVDDDTWRRGSGEVFEDLVAEALAWVGEYSASSRLVTSLVERSRDSNALLLLARALVVRADLYLRTGYWDAALADAHESATFASELSAPGPKAFALAVMARIEAGIGRTADARRHGLESLEAAEGSDLAMNAFWAEAALGFLALTQGRGPEAVARLERARAFAEQEELVLVVAVPWAPDLVEAYLRVGRVDDARQLVSQLEDREVGAQGSLAAALLARCRGLVASDHADEHFETALAAHGTVLAPFERGRTVLAYGEWLRRERRVAESVPKLESAAAIFRGLGATPYHERATAELDAHGRRSAPSPGGGRSGLTPQEFRVACTVAAGATNREAAASLFLSPRTIEHHLANIYRKLGIRSRSELARRVTTDPDFVVELD